MKRDINQNLLSLSLLAALLGGCIAHASFKAGTYAEMNGGESSGSQAGGAPHKSHHRPEHASSSDELTAQRAPDQGLAQPAPTHEGAPGPITRKDEGRRALTDSEYENERKDKTSAHDNLQN